MPIEEQINRLARKFDSFEKKFDSFEKRFDSVDAKLATVETSLTTVDNRLTTVEAKVDTTQGLLERTHALATRTHVLLEDTNAVAKLGLEGLQGLRESTDDKFAAAAKVNAGQTELLESLFVHVRKRVERVEPPKRRRRT